MRAFFITFFALTGAAMVATGVLQVIARAKVSPPPGRGHALGAAFLIAAGVLFLVSLAITV